MTWATEITADSPSEWQKFQSASANFYTSAGTLTTGIVGANDAVQMNSSSRFYSTGDAGLVVQGGVAFTVGVVFKTQPTLANRTELYFQAAQNSVEYFFTITSDGRIQAAALSMTSSAGVLSDDTWYYAALTYDGVGTARLYLNGGEVDTLSITPAAITTQFADGSDTGPSLAMFYINGYHNTATTGALPDVVTFENNLTDELVTFGSELSQIRLAAHTAELGLSPPVTGDPLSLSLPVKLHTVPPVNLYARVKLATSEAVSLSAAVKLNTRAVDLSAAISLQTHEAVSLSAPINVVSLTSANTNRAAGKWSVGVYIDGTDVSARLTGTVEIEQGEDISSLAFFTMLPVTGTVTPGDYIGNSVRIDFIDKDTNDNVLYQLTRFLGVISDPLYNPSTGELYMQCTTDLQGTLDNSTREYIDALTPTATWSPYVFEEGAQGWDYASDRMRTIPGSMWHSPSGIIITDWAAKATADVEFTDDEMFECGPYAPATRRDLLNTINASFDFRYQRQRQRTLAIKWETMQTFCDFLINGWTLCQRRMVESAATSAGWVLQGDIEYTDLPPAGYYTCFKTIGPAASKVIGWGDYQLGNLLEDADNAELCWGARWKASKRWAQTLTEHYTITMTAAQSVVGNGVVGTIESYRLETDQDLSEWVKALDYSTTDPIINGYEDVGGGLVDGDYILGDVAKDATDDELTGRTAANTAREAIIAAGVSDILSAHRQNQATMVVPFQPEVTPAHTVRAVSAHITFKGKVATMRDVWDINSGDAVTELTVALSRHEGTGLVTSSPLTPDTPPVKTEETDIPNRIDLLTYVGGRNDVGELIGDERGYFTNWIFDPTETEPFATDPANPDAILYPEEFNVEYPEISGGAVDAIELPATQEVDVEIPVDELTLTQ